MASWQQAGAEAASTSYGSLPPHVYTTNGYFAQPSRWTFTQGLVVGQISMVIIALFLIRYVIFEDSATALEKERLMRLKISERRSKRHAKALLEDARRAAAATRNKSQSGRDKRGSSKATTFASILERTAYDISTHLAESTDWLNVMFAQAIAGYREDVLAGGVSTHASKSSGTRQGTGLDVDEEPEKERTARDLMEEILNRTSTSFLDPIRVTEADFGDAYPIFTNARVRPADDTGRTRIEIDVDYSDQITLAIDTKLLINFPKPRFAVLPVSLSLTIVRFSGTLAIELFSSDPNATVLPTVAQYSKRGQEQSTSPRSRHQLHFSLHPDFALEASATSLLGSRAKLQDIPKIEQLLIARLRGWILDRFVWPRYWSLTLPNLVPSPAAQSSNASKEDVSGQMKVDTGVEQTDESVIEPGHTESLRQEMSNATTSNHPRPSLSRNDSTKSSSATMPAGASSVEAWRAHTAGAYSHSHPHTMLRTPTGGANSASGSDHGPDLVPGAFRASSSLTAAGVDLSSSTSSQSAFRGRAGYVQ